MNAILDVLKLRRILLDYVSPPVCPPAVSASGSGAGSISVEANNGAQAPANLRLGGQCDSFLLWDNPPGGFCTSLYQSNDPSGSFTSVDECLPANTVRVCSPGWWSVETVDSAGSISPRSTPVLCFSAPVRVIIPVRPGDVEFRLYKNPNPGYPGEAASQVLASGTFAAFELCALSGCYRLQAVTGDGVSDLSAVICLNKKSGCFPERACSSGYVWDGVQGSCIFTNEPLPPPPPGCVTYITNSTLPPAAVGAVYSQQLLTLGGLAPIAFAVDPATLPAWMSISAGGLVTGTPGDSDAATHFGFEVTVTDSEGNSCVQAVTGLVTCDVTGVPPEGQCCASYSYQFGSRPATGAIFSGVVPGGLSLDSSGLVTGVPTVSGPGDFIITATMPDGSDCTKVFTADMAVSPLGTEPISVEDTGVWPLTTHRDAEFGAIDMFGTAPTSGQARMQFIGLFYGTYRRIWRTPLGKCPISPGYDITCHLYGTFGSTLSCDNPAGAPPSMEMNCVVLNQRVFAGTVGMGSFDYVVVIPAIYLQNIPVGAANVFLDVQFNDGSLDKFGQSCPGAVQAIVNMDITPLNPP